MEEVWNDITTNIDSPTSTTTTTAFRGLTFLDFLSRKNPPPPPQLSSAGGYGSPASPPAVSLCLNSGPDPFMSSILQGPPHVSHGSDCLDVSFDALASASSLPGLGRKRLPESEENSGDRRHKRMIKNRESAARSRARKQAYTNELELEVAHLLEENARLKTQQQQLSLAAAAQVPKKHSLHRSSTAPF